MVPERAGARVLVTGASIPLGRAVAAALAAAGYTVRAAGRDEPVATISSTNTDVQIPAGGAGTVPEFRRGDLTNPAFVAELLADVGAIVHLAPLALPRLMPAGAPG